MLRKLCSVVNPKNLQEGQIAALLTTKLENWI